MAPQYIYTMQEVSKTIDKKQILRDISLCFFPGAKIGVLGNNGAGKSTLLRILAGVEKDFDGKAEPAKGIKIGFVAQEPELDPEKNVLENVEEAVAETKALLRQYDEINEKYDTDFKPALGKPDSDE